MFAMMLSIHLHWRPEREHQPPLPRECPQLHISLGAELPGAALYIPASEKEVSVCDHQLNMPAGRGQTGMHT